MLLLSVLLLASPGAATAACHVGAQWSMRPLAMRHKNVVRISDGELAFNGARLSDDLLRQYLQAGARTSPRPGLVIDTTDMPCAVKMRIVAHAEAAGGCTPETCSVFAMGHRPPPPALPPPGGKWP